MEENKLILEAGSEGGSIQLHQINDYFLYSTDETTLREFVPDLTLEELKTKSNVFSTLDQAMKSILGKYKIFRLYPLSVHPDFKSKIIPYYQIFCSETEKSENWNKAKWDYLLFNNQANRL